MLLNQTDSLLLLIDVQEKLYTKVVDSAAIVSRCEWLLKLSKAMHVPILVSEQYPRGLGRTIAPLATYCDAENVIEKVHFSCMQEPHFVTRLTHFNKKQLILIGMEAHVCVLQTAFDMQEAGFEVFVVVDAVSSRSAMDSKYGLKRMKQKGIGLVTAEMVFFEWLRQAGTSEFKALSQAFFTRENG